MARTDNPDNKANDRLPVALITGASEGIGAALARKFAAGGHHLLLVARNLEHLEQVRDDILETCDVQAFVLSRDLTVPGAGDDILDFTKDHGLYVRYLVNDAGRGMAGPFIEREKDVTLNMLDLNMRALTELTRIFLPEMVRRKEGGILNIASLGGFIPGPYQAAYYASKSYVISLTRAVAAENMFSGVRFSVVCPGPVATGFHKRMGAQGAYYPKVTAGCISAHKTALYAYYGFMGRVPVIIPGILNNFYAIALKFIPHAFLLPFMGWILKRRLG